MDKPQLVAELTRIFGPNDFLHEREDVLVYEIRFLAGQDGARSGSFPISH